MRYKESTSQSAEYLRLVIPLFSKHKTAANPLSYAVWYEYVAGCNLPLTQDIDCLLQSEQKLDAAQIEALFTKYISECNDASLRRLQNDLRQLLSNIVDITTHTDKQAVRFDNSLEQYVNQLKSEDLSVDTLQDIVTGLLTDTRSMRTSISTLQTRLKESNNEIDALRLELKKAENEAQTDTLTGLLNRKGLSQAFNQITSMQDNPKGHCLLMLDIDHFKRINDTCGHLLGDKVIQLIANTLKNRIKGKDTAARYGGEEFAVLLLETTLGGACTVAEDIRRVVEKGRIRRLDNKESIGNITISLGVAQYRSGESLDDLVRRADQALYRSKNQGRNRVTAEDPFNP